MFENGSYLRRRKRFKLMKKTHEDKSMDMERASKKMLAHASSPPVKLPPVKSSFFIDNLLGNDANTNISYASSSSSSASSTSSEVTSPLQHLLYASDLNIVRKLTFLSDIKAQQQQQSVFW